MTPTIREKTLIYLLIGIVLIVFMIPIYLILVSSLKQPVDMFSQPPKFIFTPTLQNYYDLFTVRPFHLQILNSLMVALGSTAFSLVVGSLAAYAIARYPNRWSADIQFFVLSLRFLPPVAVAIPLMVIWLDLGFYDTRLSLIATYTLLTLATVIWLGVPAFARVPKEVEEAARVDGYGPYAVFLRIALPVASRSLIGAVAFAFVLVWNEFLIALMLTTSDAKTLPIVASELTQLGRDVPWGILNASVVLLSIPPLLLIGILSGLLNNAFRRKSN